MNRSTNAYKMFFYYTYKESLSIYIQIYKRIIYTYMNWLYTYTSVQNSLYSSYIYVGKEEKSHLTKRQKKVTLCIRRTVSENSNKSTFEFRIFFFLLLLSSFSRQFYKFYFNVCICVCRGNCLTFIMLAKCHKKFD